MLIEIVLNFCIFQISNKKNELLELCRAQGQDNLVFKLIKRLISIIKISNNKLISEQAAICLQEIGPLRSANMLYCFDVDNVFYMNYGKVGGLQLFIQLLFEWLEKCLLNYDTLVDKTAIDLCYHLVNFTKSKSVLNNFKYLTVFEFKMKTVFDNANKLKEIDFVQLLIGIEKVSSEMFICEFVSKIFGQFSWKDCSHSARVRKDFSEQCFIAIFQLLLDNKEIHLASILKLVSSFTYIILFSQLLTFLNFKF